MTTNKLSPADLHQDQYLTDLVIGFTQRSEGFTTRKLPRRVVGKQTDSFLTYDKGDFNRLAMTSRAPGQPTSEASFGKAEDTYRCEEGSLIVPVPRELIANADMGTAYLPAVAQYLAQQRMLYDEHRFAEVALATTGVWDEHNDIDTAANGFSGAKWSDAANATIIADYQNARQRFVKQCFQYPNFAIMSPDVRDELIFSDEIRTNLFRNRDGILGEQDLANVLQLPLGIHVMDSHVNVAASGLAASVETIYSQNSANPITDGTGFLLLLYVNEAAVRNPAGGLFPHPLYMFAWSEFDNGQETVNIERYWDNDRKQWKFRIETFIDVKVTASSAGMMLYNLI